MFEKISIHMAIRNLPPIPFPGHWKPLKKSVQNGFGSSGSNSFDLQTFGQGQFPQARKVVKQHPSSPKREESWS